jgi:hypothetical protein
MVGDESPSVAGGIGVLKDIAQPIEKPAPVSIVLKYGPSFDSSGYDMVKSTGSINASFSGHKSQIA